jgi:hypothetical protein
MIGLGFAGYVAGERDFFFHPTGGRIMYPITHRGRNRAVGAILTAGSVLALTIGATGCAKHPEYDADAQVQPITITVDNNIMTPTVYTIWVTQGNTTGGSRRQLGDAPGSKVTTFNFTPLRFGQQYTIVAEPPTGRSISRPFSIDNASITGLKWQLQQNILSYFGN